MENHPQNPDQNHHHNHLANVKLEATAAPIPMVSQYNQNDYTFTDVAQSYPNYPYQNGTAQAPQQSYYTTPIYSALIPTII